MGSDPVRDAWGDQRRRVDLLRSCDGQAFSSPGGRQSIRPAGSSLFAQTHDGGEYGRSMVLWPNKSRRGFHPAAPECRSAPNREPGEIGRMAFISSDQIGQGPGLDCVPKHPMAKWTRALVSQKPKACLRVDRETSHIAGEMFDPLAAL